MIMPWPVRHGAQCRALGITVNYHHRRDRRDWPGPDSDSSDWSWTAASLSRRAAAAACQAPSQSVASQVLARAADPA